MVTPSANRGEAQATGDSHRGDSVGRSAVAELAVAVASPAVGVAAGRDTARVDATGTHRCEAQTARDSHRGRSVDIHGAVAELADNVVSPTVGVAAGRDPARVGTLSAYRDEPRNNVEQSTICARQGPRRGPALMREVFGDSTLTSTRRGDMDVVLNATELRSMSAMRFGSAESGCWRFGRVTNNDELLVAQAVAASAAFPPLLPALDELFDLEHHGERRLQRLILADGGVYENLGLDVFDPDRDPRISSNVFHPDFVFACDAGRGLPGVSQIPFWWPSRMTRSFESVYRKVQTQTQHRLHALARRGEIGGFVYAYLGQRDQRLPFVPGDLIPREEVVDYPTDFSGMTHRQIDRLTMRGEQLTRVLASQYW